jgi:hypothetical protein
MDEQTEIAEKHSASVIDCDIDFCGIFLIIYEVYHCEVGRIRRLISFQNFRTRRNSPEPNRVTLPGTNTSSSPFTDENSVADDGISSEGSLHSVRPGFRLYRLQWLSEDRDNSLTPERILDPSEEPTRAESPQIHCGRVNSPP